MAKQLMAQPGVPDLWDTKVWGDVRNILDYKTRLFLRVVPKAWEELVTFVLARAVAKSGRIGLKSCVERMRDEVRLPRVKGVNSKFMIGNSSTAYFARLMVRHIPLLRSRVIMGATKLDRQVQLDIANNVLPSP